MTKHGGTASSLSAPLSGVVTLHASVGDTVTSGQVLATIETMKLETAVTAPSDARIQRVCAQNFSAVSAGEELFVLEEHA